MRRTLTLSLLIALALIPPGCDDGETVDDNPTTTPTVTATTATSTTAAPTTTVSATTGSETSAPPSSVTYPGGASYVTGRIVGFVIDHGTVTTNGDGTSQSRDGTIEYELTSSDPRVSGTVTGTWHSNRWGVATNGAIIQWGEATVTNDNGSWEAPYSGIWTTAHGDVLTRWWQGSGDYAGLTFYMTATGTSDWEWVGFIYPGTPPAGA